MSLPRWPIAAYYRIHGNPAWISIGDTDGGFAAVDVPEPTLHAFDLKVTSRGDGVTFATAEVDSNVVETVNDAELDDAPAIDDLSVQSVGDGVVLLQWSSVVLAGVEVGLKFREFRPANGTMARAVWRVTAVWK